MSRSRPPLLAALASAALASCSGAPAPDGTTAAEAARAGDPVLVIGAGPAGLAAAVEAAAGGAQVVVVDGASVFGGGALPTDGALALVATPEQEAAGVRDTADQAEADLLRLGEDASPTMVRRFARESRAEVRDWMVGLGIAFAAVTASPGSDVPRLHRPAGGGLAVLDRLYRAALARGVRFYFGEEVVELSLEDGRVMGARLRGVRDGRPRERRAAAVILATGGFAGDLERVRTSWPRALPAPHGLLAAPGAGELGSGLELARQAGAALDRLDHIAIDATGVPDPRIRRGDRGLRLEAPSPLLVNRDGRRFGEGATGAALLRAVLDQPGGESWAIVDSIAARGITVDAPASPDPARLVERVLGRGGAAVRGDTLAELARNAELPVAALEATVAEHNLRASSSPIARPPFHAIRLVPIAHATYGGVVVDGEMRALRGDGAAVSGLYAAGAVAGYAGLVGRSALDGETLAASIWQGRIAGRAAARLVGGRPIAAPAGPAATPAASTGFADDACTSCHPREALGLDRPGWGHAASSHGDPRAARPCAMCHAGMAPYRKDAHRMDPLVAADSCRFCHAPDASRAR